MKVFQIQDEWSIDNLTLADRPEPEPGPGQVKLKMKAASINYRDLVVARRGYGSLTGTLPLIPVSDGVGEVAAVGDGVTRVAVGDRVCPTFHQGWLGGAATREIFATTLGGPVDGVMAEYMVLGEQGLVRAPEHLSDEAAATLPCAAVTAWNALVTAGALKAGDKVLVQGTGGVSLFALQFAKLHGAEVIITSSSDEKLERARALGADHGINYRSTPEWGKAARELTGGVGVDIVVEVGGAETLPQSLWAIRVGGHISIMGVLSGAATSLQIGAMVARNARLQAITVGSRETFEAMARAIALHRLEPVVDRVFDFEQLRPALDHMASGAHFGKIAIRH
jgi:NADPH:quinone reductase-like Zn-dependent oxidoreductase